MVCPPDIYNPVKFAFNKLVVVVSDIRRKIGRCAVTADYYVVLAVSQQGGALRTITLSLLSPSRVELNQVALSLSAM